MRERGQNSSMAIAAAFAPAGFAALPENEQRAMADAAFPDVNFRVREVIGGLAQLPLEHPIASAVVLGALTIGAGAPPDAAQSTGFFAGIEKAANGVADFTTKNWFWFIPTMAVVDGLVDTVRDVAAIENYNAAHPGEPPLGFGEWMNLFGGHFFGEGGEMVMATLAVGALREGKLLDPDLVALGKVTMPFYYLYAFLPDSAAKPVAKYVIGYPVNWLLTLVRSAINSFNHQASKGR